MYGIGANVIGPIICGYCMGAKFYISKLVTHLALTGRTNRGFVGNLGADEGKYIGDICAGTGWFGTDIAWQDDTNCW